VVDQDRKNQRGYVVQRILSRIWLVLGVGMVTLAILAGGVSLATAQSFDAGLEDGLQYADEPQGTVDPQSADGPEGGGGPQCSSEWFKEWYVWEDPDNVEDWWYFWWYRWCQNSAEGDWFKAYASWEWWGPIDGEDVVEAL
jgi:hypothetical protein